MRNVVIVDEAQIVAGNSGPAVPSEDSPSASSHSSEQMAALLLEIRGYGVALVLCSPLPTSVAPVVVKGTATKVAFRQVDQEEKDLIGGAMLLGPLEKEETTRKRVGEAYVFSENDFRACSIRAVNLFDDYPFTPPPSDCELVALIKDQEWFAAAANRRLTAEMDLLVERIGELNGVRREVTQTVTRLRQRLDRVMKHASPNEQRQTGQRIRARAKELLDSFDAKHRLFRRSFYQAFLDEPVPDGINPEVRSQRDRLIDWVETGVMQRAKRCRDMLEELIECCGITMEWRI